MILQSLVNYYEALAQKGEISRPGWAKVKVSYALVIDENGALISVLPLKVPDENGKKLIPRKFELPAPVKRSVGIEANFLCDNAAYMLGIDNKGKPERTIQCFEAAKTLHQSLLSDINDLAAKSLCKFFENWDISSARANPLFSDIMDELENGANLIFMFDEKFLHTNPEIAQAWQTFYDGEEEGEKMCCLITGKSVVPAATHPAIKGVYGAQSSGAALVSFNAAAYCSFERTQNINSPIGKYAAFAYTTALNHLLSDKKHVKHSGDTSIVYWAEDAEAQYQDVFSAFFDGGDENIMSNDDIDDFMKKIVQGNSINWSGIPLNPDNKFYILGLAPNAARLSVRFFLVDSFGNFVRHLKEHYDRLEIVSDNRSKWKTIPLWVLLRETVNKNASDKSPSAQMSGDTLRAILTGAFYPATLYQQTQLRIRAERKISYEKAAIIKAYLMRNTDNEDYKEVLQVDLNEQTTYQPYVLGRIFSVLEQIQEKASGVSSIKDKYFISACATPAVVFPIIMSLADKHLRKLDGAMRTYFAKQLTELTSMITKSYPAHHNLYDQGIFQLGYYHQTQKRYAKKDKSETTVNT
ncbi:MAG: type I-C CRISPR-associated protein Cas8c/Csd1 [Clostridiales bacterium]|nr:type I-C CRISPR-associated protein Cas8c/Csd1 [Clostridiales bacterium]